MTTQRELEKKGIRKPSHRDDKKVVEDIRRVMVERKGNKIILPEDMEFATVVEVMNLKIAEEEKNVELNFDFNFKLTVPEGALRLFNVLDDMYGFISHMKTPGFFGDTPPQLMTVNTSRTETQTIPWGRFRIPGIEGYLSTDVTWKGEMPYFCFSAVVQGKYKDEILRIADAVLARTDSIYRGKTISLKFIKPSLVTSVHDFFPRFMELQETEKDALVLSNDVEELVDVALFTPIEKTEFCEKFRIPLKRGILLEGPYGVGKTLTATITATLSERNGWTFIHLADVADLAKAYTFATTHQPAIVFCEDLDQALKEDKGRDDKINAILNSIDGIESKGVRIITVLTTNNVDKITQAMLRPGRIDTVIPVRPPNAEAAERLVRKYAAEKLPESEDLTRVGQLLTGKNAAVVREVVDRSTLSAVRRLTDLDQPIVLTAHDIELAALGMDAHNKLLEPKPRDERSPMEKAADALGGHLRAIAAGGHQTPNGLTRGLPTGVGELPAASVAGSVVSS
jgi:transitional endoplasmic reticulum ATPase